MKATQYSVVCFSYVLRADEHIVSQTPVNKSQTSLMTQTHDLPPGLATLLLDRLPGETFTAFVPAEAGYGVFDPAKRNVVSPKAFPKPTELVVGAQFYTQDSAGEPLSFRIIGIDGETVTVDANHQLAGKTLEYQVTVFEVRPAHPEELEYGHVHGEGGVAH